MNRAGVDSHRGTNVGRICAWVTCDDTAVCRGLCKPCYMRLLRRVEELGRMQAQRLWMSTLRFR